MTTLRPIHVFGAAILIMGIAAVILWATSRPIALVPTVTVHVCANVRDHRVRQCIPRTASAPVSRTALPDLARDMARILVAGNRDGRIESLDVPRAELDQLLLAEVGSTNLAEAFVEWSRAEPSDVPFAHGGSSTGVMVWHGRGELLVLSFEFIPRYLDSKMVPAAASRWLGLVRCLHQLRAKRLSEFTEMQDPGGLFELLFRAYVR